jgi:hypothetical protein
VEPSWVLWTTCCSVLLASPAAAQRPIDQICASNLVDSFVPSDAYWKERHPLRMAATVEVSEEAGRWDASLGELVRLFAEDAQFFGERRPQYDSLSTRLAEFQATVQATDNAGRSTGIPGAVDFNVRPRSPGYNALNTRLSLDEGFDENQLRSLCYTVHSVRRYNERLTLWAREASQAELDALVKRWRTFNDVGMTPYPWEMLGNRLTGWLGSSDALAPPTRQMILLRPQVGAELDNRFNDRQNVISVELLGAVQYIGNGGWYLGGSLVWTSPDEGPSGLGAMIHMAQWFKGGPVWRDRDGDGDRELGWLLSVDLFDLFRGAPAELLDRARQAAEAAAETAASGPGGR